MKMKMKMKNLQIFQNNQKCYSYFNYSRKYSSSSLFSSSSSLSSSSSSSKSNKIGIVLDIDGVILKGSKIINESYNALKLINKYSLPFTFLSNGGGILEENKVNELNNKLNIEINSNQIILSHTPFKQLTSIYNNKNILIIGNKKCKDIAKSYGFNNIFTSSQLHYKDPHIYPIKYPQLQLEHHQLEQAQERDKILSIHNIDEKIDAAFIFAESCDWGLDIQVLTDLIITHENQNKNSNIDQFPIYACNSDIVYNSNHKYPRFTQGAFLHSFQSLYYKYRSKPVIIQNYGKPYPIQYEYAMKVLEDIVSKDSNSSNLLQNQIKRYYAIGDNPASDMRGARNAGSNWKSILVRTGIHTSKDNDPIDPADFVEDNVYEAIKRILKEEQIDTSL